LLKLILFLAAELEMVRRFSETLAQASSVAVPQLRQIGSGRTCTTNLYCCCSPEADFGRACASFIMHAAYLRRRFLEGLIAQASNLHPLKQFHLLRLITLCESIVLFHICIPVKPFCA
jgi:hypothetical protein